MIGKVCVCLAALLVGLSCDCLAAPEEADGTPPRKAVSQATVSPVEQAFSGVELEPVSCKSAALEKLVERTVDELVDDEMSTFEKMEACYDYVAETVRYGNHMAYLNTAVEGSSCADIFYIYGEVEGFGAVALTAGVGQCNAYASAFILMARNLGLPARLVTGGTLSAGGGYAYHKWAEIPVGDTVYVFDPQLDQDLTAAGLPAHSVFCKTYEQLGRRYQKYS